MRYRGPCRMPRMRSVQWMHILTAAPTSISISTSAILTGLVGWCSMPRDAAAEILHPRCVNLSTLSSAEQKRKAKEEKLILTEHQAQPLFHDLLRFWTAARFIEGGWRCYGAETLDADKLPDPLNPPSLVAPPPYIDFQLAAVVMEGVLAPLQKRILARLDKLFLTYRARNWFHIFLAIFVLLQSYELVFAHEVAWTKKRRWHVSYFFLGLLTTCLKRQLTDLIPDTIRRSEPHSPIQSGCPHPTNSFPPFLQRWCPLQPRF